MTHYCIYQLVYLRKGEGILRIGFVQINKIHTHSPLPVFLFYYHSFGQPLGVEHFLNGPYLLKLSHFIPNSIKVIFG